MPPKPSAAQSKKRPKKESVIGLISSSRDAATTYLGSKKDALSDDAFSKETTLVRQMDPAFDRGSDAVTALYGTGDHEDKRQRLVELVAAREMVKYYASLTQIDQETRSEVSQGLARAYSSVFTLYLATFDSRIQREVREGMKTVANNVCIKLRNQKDIKFDEL